MLHIKFQISEPTGSEEENFAHISMHYYGLNLGPPGAGPSWFLGHTKFQASEPRGYEEDFLIFFYAFLWFEPPWRGLFWTLGPWFK